MKVLVTGATGFIGRELVKQLSERGYETRCLARNSSDTSSIKDLRGVEIWNGDVTDTNSLKGVCEGIDAVIHLAAIGTVNAVSKKQYDLYKKVNVEGTQNMLKECSRIKRFIHVSSIAAMGGIKDKRNVNESKPCNPVLPYEKTKYDSETLCWSFEEKNKKSVVVVRPPIVYDMKEGGQSYTRRFLKMVKRGFVLIPGDGKGLMNIIKRESLAKKLIEILGDKNPKRLYITIEETVTLDEMVDRIAKYYGKNVLKIHVPKLLLYPAGIVFEVLAKVFGFVPPFNTRIIDYI